MKEIRPMDLWIGRLAAAAGIVYVALAGLRSVRNGNAHANGTAGERPR